MKNMEMNEEKKQTDLKEKKSVNPEENEAKRAEARPEFEEYVLEVDRVSRTVKGGKRMRFRALVIVGNRNGKIGIGIGKASEVATAVAKASTQAKKELVEVPIVNESIPYPVDIRQGAAHIILKPAKPGSSVIAGGTIRVMCNLVGIRNLVAKMLGTANKINNAQTTMLAFKKLARDWQEKQEKNISKVAKTEIK